MTQLQDQFDLGLHERVIAALRDTAQTPEEHRLLGMAYLRDGQYPQAELPLLQAHLRGDPEAGVEYGNLLRVLGRLEEAQQHFTALHPHLTGELALRCLRWWGVSELLAGHPEDSIQRLERAWHGYMRYGNEKALGRHFREAIHSVFQCFPITSSR